MGKATDHIAKLRVGQMGTVDVEFEFAKERAQVSAAHLMTNVPKNGRAKNPRPPSSGPKFCATPHPHAAGVSVRIQS